MKLRKLLSLVLAAVIFLGCMTVAAFAGGGGVYYLYPEYNKTDGTFYENCSSGIKEWKEGLCEDFYYVKSDDKTWGETGETRWYVAMGQISIANTVTVQGDVRLILCDGATLTITGSTGAGIDNYGEGNSFTVYAESTGEDMGILIVTGDVNSSYFSFAGIRSAGGATVTINGGVLTAHPGDVNDHPGACIGGNSGEDGSNITINSGKVTADGAVNAAGIGGGSEGNGEYITINGGTVVSGNRNNTGAGIGGGARGSGENITINGGTVTAISNDGAGIGSGSGLQSCSYITITGGTVTAEGNVGIGGTYTTHDIIISGGMVTATGKGGPGIGAFGKKIATSQVACYIYNGNAWNITISGRDTVVSATTKDNFSAAIGGGTHGYGKNIVIKDGATVIAKSIDEGAAIGGGGRNMESYEDVDPKIGVPYSQYTKIGDGSSNGDAEGIIISGEGTTVIAIGGGTGAGIGAGQYGNASNITITDGAKVYATTTSGSAIGAGSLGSADGITISEGAEVVAVSLAYTAAIGARYNASNITIDNATVTAKSGEYGTAIGSALGTANNIVIKGEDTVVTAATGDAEAIGAEGRGSAIGAGSGGSATGIYVDPSLLMVQNNDETLTDDMEICKDREATEDVSSTVCNKDKCVIVIKPRDAYVAQVGTGDNATKYYFLQTAIEKATNAVLPNVPGLIKEGDVYKISQEVAEEKGYGFEYEDVEMFLDNVSVTLIADTSEEVELLRIQAEIPFYGEYDMGIYLNMRSTITLDLNGHVLSSFFDSGESAIWNECSLTLIDSNPTAEHAFTVDENGLYCWDEDFNSQVSSRLQTDEDGNYFWDDEAAIVTVKGGCITGVTKGRFYGGTPTIAGVYNNGGIFNMYAGTITGNSASIGGGVYNIGTMTVGGTAVIEGNTVYGTDTAQNVYLKSGTKITIDNLTEGANIGVTTETKPEAGSPIEFTTNGTKNDEDYFLSDSLDYADKYYNEGTCLDLILGYRVTPRKAEGGTISVGNQKSAYDGETVKVKVTPDEGYALDTLAFSGEGIIATNITDKKSFTMPAKEVVITGTFNQAEYALSGSASITDGGVTFKKGDTIVTTAKFGDEIIVIANEVEGYTVAFTSDDVSITDSKFTMPAKAVTVTASYTKNQEPGDDNSVYLDLEEDVTYADKHSIVQKYTFTQTSERYTDVTKVKIEWTITDIAATYKSHKTWDPDTLTWVEVKEDVAAADQSATFKITNYSTKSVTANVAFVVENEVKDTYDATNSSYTNNDCTIATPVVHDATTTYTDADFTARAQKITATLAFKQDEFAKMNATTQTTKYGTYTVTISEATTPLTVCGLTGSGYSVTKNTLVFEGANWGEVIANNQGNTVIVTDGSLVEECYLTSEIDRSGLYSYVILKKVSDNELLAILFATDVSQPNLDISLKTTDTLSDTIYFTCG